MSEYGSFRSGWDGPSRISTSTVFLQEATETLPAEPTYLPLPFTPTSSSGSSSTSADGRTVWTRYPFQCDLSFYQGDDVVVTLQLQDPNNPDVDMSDTNTWQWFAQIRARHSYTSTLINDFSVDSYFVPAAPPNAAMTVVQLFLPRELNTHRGIFDWELYSISNFDYANFPKPADWPTDEVWPPTDTLKTWLWGNCTIVPRTSTTDELLSGDTSVSGGGGGVVATAFVVGPNGRVP
jgi:hypothetical protein